MKKKKIITKPSGPSPVAHDEPITGSSLTASPQILNQKKKKKNTENEKSNPSRLWHLAESHHVTSSLAERLNPITQYKSKPNTELSKPNTLTQRTEHRGV